MDKADFVGTWAVSVGQQRDPRRLLTLLAEGSIRNWHGEEAFWSVSGSSLLLQDKSRCVVSIFDISGTSDGYLPGRLRGLDYAESPVWLSRHMSPGLPVAAPALPDRAGPLAHTVKTAAEFNNAWMRNDDFSVVLFDGSSLKARPAVSESLNLGSTPQAKHLMDFMVRDAPSGFNPLPVFMNILHDCWLVDGTTVVTRDGFVLHETSQLTGSVFTPLGDADFYLRGREGELSVSSSHATAYIQTPTFLFGTVRLNYGSWLLHSVPGWIFIDWISQADAAAAAGLALAINGGLEREPFRADSLDLLGLENPIFPTPKGIVHFKKLVVPPFHRSHSRPWPGVAAAYRKMASTARTRCSGIDLPRRIYASRSGQTRSFADAAGIDAVLNKYDFTPIVGGTIPFAQQVAAYAGAEFVFGSYGSNMSNISYCDAGATVVDIIDEIYGFAATEYLLANANDLNYCAIITPVSERFRELPFDARPPELSPDVLDDVLRKLIHV